MAKYFYFTRHGQTVWNVENKICGATDIALTDLGHQQAAELGERILKEGINGNSGERRTSIKRTEFWKI